MIRQISCASCGLSFELIDPAASGKLFCPNCANEIDSSGLKKVETIGPYKLGKLLGQGGMGQVYSAAGPDGNTYALKVMIQESLESPELIERFDREMAIMSSLDHPNIVKVIDRGSTASFKYFLMELVEGTTLRQLIRGGSLTENRILEIGIGILSALSHAHSHGIVHRDIKPENILFDRNETVKVTDFGLARKFSSTSDQQSLTATNAFMGTENYMSPEQKVNPKAVTHKTDIYATGVVFYEMLTGGLLPMGIFQPPSYYKPVHQYWDTLTFRMLDLNPDMRPDNCGAIISELERFREHCSEISTDRSPKQEQGEGVAVVNPEVTGARDQSFEQFLEAENDRMRLRLLNMMDDANEQFKAGNYEVALPLFEASLAVVLDPDERSSILEWMRLCRDKILAAKASKKLVFMCPECLKTFERSASGEMPEKLSCPLCHCSLKYDDVRKQLRKNVQNIKKTASSSEKPVEASCREKPAGQSMTYQVALLMLVAMALIDWSYPDLFEGCITWLCDKGLSATTGISPGNLILGSRFILHLTVLIVTIRIGYILSGF